MQIHLLSLGTNYTEEFLRIRFRENAKEHYPKAFTMRSDLPFVRDLQTSAISSVNRAYDRNRKAANLKQMADTILYMENHNIPSREALDQSYDALHSDTVSARQALKRSEDSIKALNEQIHFTGQYLANKGTYQAFLKAKNKGRFRSEHESEIILYESARKYLKDHANDGTLPSLAYFKSDPDKFPNIRRIKAVRSDLIAEQKQLRQRYYSAWDAEKELYAVKRNVDTMLREPTLFHTRRQQTHTDLLE